MLDKYRFVTWRVQICYLTNTDLIIYKHNERSMWLFYLLDVQHSVRLLVRSWNLGIVISHWCFPSKAFDQIEETWKSASCLFGSNFSPTGFSCTNPCFPNTCYFDTNIKFLKNTSTLTFNNCVSVSWSPWCMSLRYWLSCKASEGTAVTALFSTSATSSRSWKVSCSQQKSQEMYATNLAEALDAKNLGVWDLLVHPISKVFKICQTSSVFVKHLEEMIILKELLKGSQTSACFSSNSAMRSFKAFSASETSGFSSSAAVFVSSASFLLEKKLRCASKKTARGASRTSPCLK